MSVIIKGKQQEVPGVKTECWKDPGTKVKMVTDKDKRTRAIRGIVCHTHEGLRGTVLPGFGPNTTLDERLALYQVTTDRYVSWDYTIDMNGDVTWQNDPTVFYTWQAGNSQSNSCTLGFEFIQKIVGSTGDLYQGQIDKAVVMIDFITAKLGIQRQIPWDKTKDKPVQGVLTRLRDGGSDFVGIYGHRNITSNRGPGDPGDGIFLALRAAGYETFDLSSKEDITIWKQRQQMLGIIGADQDGLPLTKTVAALKASGHKHGMWVSRPIDSLITEE